MLFSVKFVTYKNVLLLLYADSDLFYKYTTEVILIYLSMD